MLSNNTPAMKIKSETFVIQNEHGHIGHRTYVDKLLDGILNVSFVQYTIQQSLGQVNGYVHKWGDRNF